MKLNTKTIGEISVSIRTGKTPPTKHQKYFDGEFNWYTPGDFNDHIYLLSSKRTITDLAVSEKKATLFEKNTVLISCIGDIGKIGLLRNTASCNQQITGVSLSEEINPLFFSYWCKANKSTFERKARNAVVPILNNAVLSAIKVTYPVDINDQIRIAHLLNKVEGLIAQRKQHLQQLDDLLKSVFLEMFGDPVRNEKGWEKKSFSDLISDIESGKSPKCEAREATENEWGVLKLSAVTSCYFQENENKALPVNVEAQTRHEVKQGDLLFSRKNTYELVAACAYVFKTRSKLLMPDLIFRFVFKEEAEVNPIFIWKLLTADSQRRKIQSLAAGAAGSMPNISKTNLKQVLLPVPPPAIQNKFATIVGKVEGIKSHYQQSLTELENLYGALSQKAFKGEFDLSRIPLILEQEVSNNLAVQLDEKTDKEQGSIPIDEFHEYPFSNPESRKKMLRQMFNQFLNELKKGDALSLDDFWKSAYWQSIDYTEEADMPFRPEDNDLIKNWLFESIGSRRLEQAFDKDNNKIILKLAS